MFTLRATYRVHLCISRILSFKTSLSTQILKLYQIYIHRSSNALALSEIFP